MIILPSPLTKLAVLFAAEQLLDEMRDGKKRRASGETYVLFKHGGTGRSSWKVSRRLKNHDRMLAEFSRASEKLRWGGVSLVRLDYDNSGLLIEQFEIATCRKSPRKNPK